MNETKIDDNSSESKKTEESAELKELKESKTVKEFSANYQQTNIGNDYIKKNKTPVTLKRLLPVNYQYNLVSKTEIDNLLEKGKKNFEKYEEERKLSKGKIIPEEGNDFIWKPYYEKYPCANGYYQFSRIGFSPNKNFARVDVNGEGAEWSTYTYYILKKKKRGWIIYTAFGFTSVA